MFEPFQAEFKKTANRHNLGRALEASEICTVAKQIIEVEYPKLAPLIQVRFFKNNTLYLHSQNSVISQEFFYHQVKILELINQKLRKEIIKKLSLTLKENPLN